MPMAANDNHIKMLKRKRQILAHQIEKMEGDLLSADRKRKRVVIGLIPMGQRRIAELRTLH
jgi:hypothetical protein